nr:hypothetical protein [Actinomadura glauciflava]
MPGHRVGHAARVHRPHGGARLEGRPDHLAPGLLDQAFLQFGRDRCGGDDASRRRAGLARVGERVGTADLRTAAARTVEALSKES